MTIRPVAGKLLLRIIPAEEVKVGGIIMQASDEEARRSSHREALVEGLPTGYRGELSLGDKVLVPPYAGSEIKLNGVRFVFIKPEILAAAVG